MIRRGQSLKPMVRLPKNPEACWEWLGHVHQESGVAMKHAHHRCVPARRWMWENLFGPIERGMVISQKCGNVACVNPYHLAKMTLASALREGSSAKLMASDVSAIRAAKVEYLKGREGTSLVRLSDLARRLAREYEVSPSTIYDAWRGDTWSRQTKCPHARSVESVA